MASMTAAQRARRNVESTEYFSPVWYTTSGAARVCCIEGRYRAEIAISGGWAAIGVSSTDNIHYAIGQAIKSDRFSAI